MIDVTNALSPSDRKALEEMTVVPVGLDARVFKRDSAYYVADIQDGNIQIQAIGFAYPLDDVTEAVRSSDPRAAFDCKTDAMEGILDDYPIQWFRQGAIHYGAFLRNNAIEIHECNISYDHDRISR